MADAWTLEILLASNWLLALLDDGWHYGDGSADVLGLQKQAGVDHHHHSASGYLERAVTWAMVMMVSGQQILYGQHCDPEKWRLVSLLQDGLLRVG
jgi:hypothetical protein